MSLQDSSNKNYSNQDSEGKCNAMGQPWLLDRRLSQMASCLPEQKKNKLQAK
jgi:hypothetical protein